MTTPASPAPAMSPLRQAVRMARAELVLFYRYRTAAFTLAMPLFFVALGVMAGSGEVTDGVEAGAYNVAGMLAMGPLMLAVLHVINVLTARRETLILKRFRVSGVPPAALFGSVTLGVWVASIVLAAVIIAALVGVFGAAPPQNPLLLAVSVTLATVVGCLLSAAFTRVCRNSEGAQMLSMIPFLVFYASSGLMFPLEIFPQELQILAHLLPAAPATEIATSAYFGYDFVGGVSDAAPAGMGEVWLQSLPGLGVLLAWLAVSVLLLRWFRWDPRDGG